jgi:cytokinin dehydrogenase
VTRPTWTPDLLSALARTADVDTSDSARAEASRDWGHLVRGQARGVARASSARDVQQIVRFARDHGLALTVRGGGMSQSGQSVPRDGLSLDVRALRAVGAPDRDRLTVSAGPGATWRQLLTELLPLGLAPRVVPLNLDLTVGGTLSAGGFGSTSHRFGPAVSQVPSLSVVTDSGDSVVCGPTRERTVFDAVLGGVGRGGVIVGADLALRRVPPKVRTFYLAYDDLSSMIHDQSQLQHADHVEAFCAATVHGLRKGPSSRRQPLVVWSYGLHVSIEHAEGNAPRAGDVLSGLKPVEVLHVEDDSAEGFASRYDVRFEAMKATGTWGYEHPWVECVLPLDAALRVIPRALAALPMFLGDGHRIFSIADTDRPRSLKFPDRGPFVSFAVLPMGVPPGLSRPALDALRALHDLVLSEGGTRYLSGWQFRSAPGGDRSTDPDVRPPTSLFESCLSPA